MTANGTWFPVREWRVDQLQVRLFSNRSALGRAAGLEIAQRLKRVLQEQNQAVVIFAAAPSQNETLDILREVEDIDWRRVVALHMDEYVGLPPSAPQLFGCYLRERIWDTVNPGSVHFLNGNTSNLADECQRYSDLLRLHPADIVCGGIGENGHLAFNDPHVADFTDTSLVKVVELDVACRRQQVHDGCFAHLRVVPTQALTLTIPAIIQARWFYCMVPGNTKTHAVKATLLDPISENVPATIIRTHPRATLFIDEDSGSELQG